MNKKIMLAITCTIAIIKPHNVLAQIPISHCEAFNAIRIAMIMNVEELKLKAEQGDIESALNLIDLSKIFSDSNDTPSNNFCLKNLKMLNSTGYLNENIKNAFSEQTYAECKHIFEPNSDITNNEEISYNDRED